METENNEESVRVSRNAQQVIEPESSTEKLFVYGIFLDELNRQYYGMENPSYDTVLGFITVGDSIVTAIPSTTMGASLTGLLVDVPSRNFPKLDMLEARYDRIKVNTTGGFEAFMYATQGVSENFSTFTNKYYEQEFDEAQESLPL